MFAPFQEDPVINTAGQSYDRRFIEEWYKEKNTDPNTNLPVPSKILIPNHSLRGLIIEWKEKHKQ